MAMSERKEKIGTRIVWWPNLICIWNYSNITTCKFWEGLCRLWRYIHSVFYNLWYNGR